MMNNDEFVEMDETENQFTKQKTRQKSGVIKNVNSHMKGTIHLDPVEENQEDGVEFFQPIYEGDLIVGVIHKCNCGKIAELRFQYSDQ
ncbi:MAG: hypothetical protein U9Q77_01225 [Candidatus Marinimicrobia bacterium]|nr:hypothetical protein [Candidatus Neomarinimicrobiota bacterium]